MGAKSAEDLGNAKAMGLMMPSIMVMNIPSRIDEDRRNARKGRNRSD
ncbi:hypothetical protein [Ignatzschineria cameli]|nr:hypothetical protein [Ignatzschineria cameli]